MKNIYEKMVMFQPLGDQKKSENDLCRGRACRVPSSEWTSQAKPLHKINPCVTDQLQKTNTAQNESGVVLIAVICFAAIAAILAVGLMTESSTHLKLAGRNVNLEKAFYAAEGGAERAVAYVRNGGVVPTNLTGTIGNGTYAAYILATPDTAGTGGTHTVSGSININPNSSPQHEFLLMTTDGQAFDRDSLQNTSLQDYSGNANLVRVKPKGSSDQTITVDGASYVLEKNTAYNFVGDSFPVTLSNDGRDTNGLAMGQWWINIGGSGISLGDDPDPASVSVSLFSIYSIGTVEGINKTIYLDGVHQESWAKYALWYHTGPSSIQITSGETFNGPVHANTYIYLTGNPIFNALISTTKSWWQSGSSTSAVSFNAGYLFNAPAQSMASVSFDSFLPKAELVVTGLTSITLSGSNMVISNSRLGWTTNIMTIPSNGLIYARTTTTGSDKQGTVNVGGTLDGRLTIVADYDVNITNHLNYAVHPTNNSDDALGLVSGRNVTVALQAPSNLKIFAHIMAVGSATTSTSDGSFEVANLMSRGDSGLLNVYGGIVQYYRGTIGSGSHGYWKNYTFDTRLETAPPPEYPAITNEYVWSGWRER